MDEQKLLDEIRQIRGVKHKKQFKTPNIKRKTHKVFDHLWKSGRCSRREAYCLLQLTLKIWQRKDAHIRKLDEDQCRQLINVIESGRVEILKAKMMSAAYNRRIFRRGFFISHISKKRYLGVRTCVSRVIEYLNR